jgi:hypothetical protein
MEALRRHKAYPEKFVKLETVQCSIDDVKMTIERSTGRLSAANFYLKN